MMSNSGGSQKEWRLRIQSMARCRGVWVLACLMVATYILVGIGGQKAWVYGQGGLGREGMMCGRVWQIVSYALLHGSWWHLGMNVLLLVMVGSRIEHVCGAGVLMRVIGLGVLVGGLAHLATSNGVLVGVSGGVLALMLCYCGLSPESKVMVPLRVSAKSLGRGVLIAEVLLLLMNPQAQLPGVSLLGKSLSAWGLGSMFQISHACHLGGAFAGWLYARWLLRPRVSLESLQRDRAKREKRGGVDF